MKKVAVLGCGNMVQALLKSKSLDCESFEFHLFNPTFSKADKLASQIGAQAYREIKEMPLCDYYLLGCKPQQIESLSLMLKGIIPKSSTILSILAAVNIERIQFLFSHDLVARIMPNLPTQFDKGIILLFSAQEDSFLEKMWQGETLTFKCHSEDELDKLTILTASGPGILLFILQEFYASFGLNSSYNHLLVKLFEGTSDWLTQSEDKNDLHKLIQSVCSKGGVTQRYIEELSDQKIQSTFNNSFNKSLDRLKELSLF